MKPYPAVCIPLLPLVLSLWLAVPAFAARYDIKAAIVMDMNSRQILFEQNADQRIAPASLTKILSMYLVLEDVEKGRIGLKDKVLISQAAANTGGSSMRLQARERVSIEALLNGMAIASGNDACVAVAQHLAGSEQAFVERMNRKARFLGMQHSTFKNSHGLPAKGQRTTARDMMLLADAYLRRFPQTLAIHSKTHMFHNKIRRNNSNRLLGTVPGVDGLKTGYVAASGFNIIVTAKRNGRRLLAVVLGGSTAAERNRETERILEAAFGTSPGPDRPRVQVATAPVAPEPQTRPAVAASEPDRNQAVIAAALQHAAAAAVASDGPQLRAAVPQVIQEGAEEFRDASAPQFGQPLYALHESSWRTDTKARERVEALRKRGVHDPRVESVHLGEQGVWYRVYIGQFASMRQARDYSEILARQLQLRHAVILQLNS